MPIALHVRPFSETDWPSVWAILEPIFRAGETYPVSPNITESEAHHYWIESVAHTYVAESDDAPLGTYYLKPNSAALGAHVANAGYAVSNQARRLGVGRAMGEHSLQEARRHGYLAMQFNLIVSTNTASIALWKSLGFHIVGTLPRAFHHQAEGYVDAHVMYQWIGDQEA